MNTTYFVILIVLQSISLVVSIISLIGVIRSRNISVSSEEVCVEENSYKFYITYVGVKSKGQRVYGNVVSNIHYHESLTENEIANYRSLICASNPEFKECSILYWTRIEK